MTGALIVTALLDPALQARFDEARQRHFPAARNFLPAHVTLFHALPGRERKNISTTLLQICATQTPASVATRGLRFLGGGVAYELHMPELAALRAKLAGLWWEWLTPQDRQGFRPHVTVQNKVAPEVARALLEELQTGYAVWRGEVQGLTLWRYDNGPWSKLAELRFRVRSFHIDAKLRQYET